MNDPISELALVPAASEPPRRVAPGGPPPRPVAGWALAVFVALCVVRLPLANAGLFHHDEVQLARAVERSSAEGALLPAVKGRYGAVLLGMAFHAPLRLVGGARAERAVPIAGVVMGALLVAGLLLLAHELTRDRLAGALAAAFAASGTLFLTSSSTGKENVPQLAVVVLASWLISRASRTGTTSARLGAMALFAFGVSIHEGGIVLVPVFVLFAAAVHLRDRTRRRALALDLGALAVALVVPVVASVWDELRRNTLVFDSNSANFLGPFSPALKDALLDAAPALGAAPLALAAVGLVRAAVARDVALLGIAPWLLAVLYFGNVTSYGPRYLLYVLPPVAVLAGAGGAWLVVKIGALPGRVAVAALLVAAAAVPGVGRAYPLLAARARHSGPKAMALFVKERTEPDALVVCMDDSVFLEYYAGRRTLTHPVGDPSAIASFVHDLRQRVRDGARVYLGSYAFTYDRWDHFRGLVESTFVLVPVGQVVNEWYYRPELEDVSFDDVLYRLELRSP